MPLKSIIKPAGRALTAAALTWPLLLQIAPTPSLAQDASTISGTPNANTVPDIPDDAAGKKQALLLGYALNNGSMVRPLGLGSIDLTLPPALPTAPPIVGVVPAATLKGKR